MSLVAFFDRLKLLPSLQSAYRKKHSTGTAVLNLKVITDVLNAADRGEVSWQWASKQLIKFRWRRTDSPDGGTDITTLVRRALAEVCHVPVLLILVFNKLDKGPAQVSAMSQCLLMLSDKNMHSECLSV